MCNALGVVEPGSNGSPITIYSSHRYVYKQVYKDFTKNKKEKSQYQDTIHSEAEGGHCDRPCMCSWHYQYHLIDDLYGIDFLDQLVNKSSHPCISICMINFGFSVVIWEYSNPKLSFWKT